MDNKKNSTTPAAEATAASENTAPISEDRESWAIIRAAHEEAIKRIAEPDYSTGFEQEHAPDASAPFVNRIDYMTFCIFCEGIDIGLKIAGGGRRIRDYKAIK